MPIRLQSKHPSHFHTRAHTDTSKQGVLTKSGWGGEGQGGAGWDGMVMRMLMDLSIRH